MKKSIFSIAISVLISSSMTVIAQEEMPPMPEPGTNNIIPARIIPGNPLTRDLNLTEEQSAQLEALENPFLPQSMERRAAKTRQAKSPQALDKAQAQDSVAFEGETTGSKASPLDLSFKDKYPENAEELALIRYEYLRKVRKILSEEQYVKYMENLLLYMAPQPREMGNFPGGQMHKRGPKNPHTRGNTELIR